MYKSKDRIYINQWLEFKPYENQVITDSYYLKLCNKVKDAIYSNKQFLLLMMLLDKDEINDLSCFLTSYFEDLISDTNLWNIFVRQHQDIYNKPLPFYDIDEYYYGEINVHDISFLIWYFINSVNEDKYISPVTGFVNDVAETVYDVFDKEWEYAPENNSLKSFYTIDKSETDYYLARNLIDIILFQSYLFYPDSKAKLDLAELKIISENKSDLDNLFPMLSDNRVFFIYKIRTRLLAFKGQEWAANLLGEEHPLYSEYLNMSPRIQGLFLYKGQDDNTIFLEHIASGKKFNLAKKSFDESHLLKVIDSIVYIGIVRWRNEWWFSGGFFQIKYDATIVSDEKNSIESRKEVDFLDYNEINVDKYLEQQLKAFLEFTNGNQIVFIESNKLDDFLNNYSDYFNNYLKLSKKAKRQAIEKANAEGFFGGNDKENHDFSEDSESALVFFNPKSGIEIGFNINSAFPLPNNPFYNQSDSNDNVISLLMEEELSTELALFCVDNCKSDLAFFNDEEGEVCFLNIDFLLRFWKNENFFSTPSISFTGTSKDVK